VILSAIVIAMVDILILKVIFLSFVSYYLVFIVVVIIIIIIIYYYSTP